MSRKMRPFMSLALAACAWQSTSVLADSCTAVSVLPLVITQPGKYCLIQSLRYEGATPIAGQLDNAITISSDDVTVDFNGFTLQGGTNASVNPASAGIRAADRKNITIKNGAIRNFGIGAQLTDVSGGITPLGYWVENLLIDGSLVTGLSISSQNATVRNNRISNLASTSTTYAASGIVISGANVRVANNSISNVTSATTVAVGIYLDASGGVVENNSVSNLNPGKSGYGVLTTGATNGVVVRGNVFSNTIASTGAGILLSSGGSNVTVDGNAISGFATGLNLSGSNASKYKNNTVNGATTPYYGGANIGGNY